MKTPSDYILCITDCSEVVATCSFLAFIGRPYNMVNFNSKDKILSHFTVLTVLSMTLENYEKFFSELTKEERKKLFPFVCLVKDGAEKELVQKWGGSFFIRNDESDEDVRAKLGFIEQLSHKIRDFAEIERRKFAEDMITHYGSIVTGKLQELQAIENTDSQRVTEVVNELIEFVDGLAGNDNICLENYMDSLRLLNAGKTAS